MNRVVVASMCFFCIPLHGDYKELKAYGMLLYNSLSGYVLENPKCCSDDVRRYIESKDNVGIFNDASDSAYSHLQVLMSAYQIATQPDQTNSVVKQALRDDINMQRLWNRFPQYACYGATAFNTIISMLTVCIFSKYRKHL